MFHITLDFWQRAVIIPNEVVQALGSPNQINFLYHPEKKMFAIRECPLVETGDGGRKERESGRY